jgi:CDP-diacylglycerol--glycerol-3-phosphate 3-phosphatidyltransferase
MIAQVLSPPNLVTLARLALTPFIVQAILSGRRETALIFFALAAATDFLDGLLARATKAITHVGQYLDPIADKVLLCAVFWALAVAKDVPVWFVAIVFGRDLALLVASAIAMRFSRYDNYRPTVWGKISTVCQVAAAVFAMAGSGAVRDAVWLSAAATLWSAVHYTWRGVSFFVDRAKTPAMGRRYDARHDAGPR